VKRGPRRALVSFRAKVAVLGFVAFVALFGYQTRALRNLDSFEPLRPRWWNTFDVSGFTEEELQQISIVWSAANTRGYLEEVVFERGKWRGVPNEYGEQSLWVLRDEKVLCAMSLFKFANWFVLDYRLVSKPGGCELSASGPTRAWPFEELFGALQPNDGSGPILIEEFTRAR
jgi:hypothetical protein